MGGLEVTINLEDFVNKEVVLTFANDSKKETVIRKDNSGGGYPFYFRNKNGNNQYYSLSGVSWSPNLHNIIDIHLKQPQKTMALSDKTIENLANALAPEAAECIRDSEEYIQFMGEQLTKFMKEKLGPIDDEIAVEIVGIMIADKLDIIHR